MRIQGHSKRKKKKRKCEGQMQITILVITKIDFSRFFIRNRFSHRVSLFFFFWFTQLYLQVDTTGASCVSHAGKRFPGIRTGTPIDLQRFFFFFLFSSYCLFNLRRRLVIPRKLVRKPLQLRLVDRSIAAAVVVVGFHRIAKVGLCCPQDFPLLLSR